MQHDVHRLCHYLNRSEQAAGLFGCVHSLSARLRWRAALSPPPSARNPNCARVREASLERDRSTSSVPKRRAASVKKYTPVARRKHAAGTEIASNGVASFYTEGTKTASGEKFNTHDLTAAHPTLPFGTRLRVTNVTNGQAVTVRVNDRGPYIQGRIVDVSYSAADALGMVGKGLANVSLDVVR